MSRNAAALISASFRVWCESDVCAVILMITDFVGLDLRTLSLMVGVCVGLTGMGSGWSCVGMLGGVDGDVCSGRMVRTLGVGRTIEVE